MKVRSAIPRGDVRYYQLFCVKKNVRQSVTSAGFGGYLDCRNSALKIRTFGAALKIKIMWKAQATTGFSAYRKSHTYTT